MNKKIALLSLLFLLGIYVVKAEDSPFDALQGDDRYKAAPSEFDVNEGEEEQQQASESNNGSNIFDVMQEAPEYEGSYYKVAKIVALNKITAKSQELTINVGEVGYFGNIAIEVEKCWNNQNPYSPESKILLKVVESRLDEDPHNIFLGWIISGNIAASFLEHPSYELIAIGCENDKK